MAWSSRLGRSPGSSSRAASTARARQAETDERDSRLKKLHRQQQTLTSIELGKVYEEKYGGSMPSYLVDQILRKLGVKRVTAAERKEQRQRPKRLQALLREHPHLTYAQLAEKYRERYAINVDEHQVWCMLAKRTGLIAERARWRTEERAERVRRLEGLHRAHPDLSCYQLAQEYMRVYGFHLSPHTTENCLRQAGIYLEPPFDPEEFAQRSARLGALAAERPELSCGELAVAYQERSLAQR